MSIAKKSLIDFTSQIGVFFLSFISGIVISKILGVDGRGIWVTVLFVNTFLHNLSCFALEITNTYLAGKEKNNIASLHSWSIVIILLISIDIFVIVFPFREFFRTSIFGGIPSVYMWTGILMIPFSLYFAAWRGMLVGLGEIKVLSIVNLLYQVVQALLIIYITIFSENPIPYLVISWALVQVVLVAVILVVLYKVTGKGIFGKLDKDTLHKMSKFSIAAHIGNFATSLVQRIDWLYINKFVGTSGIGMYSQATTFTDKISFIPQAVERGGYSRVTAASLEEAKALTVKIFRNTLYISLCAMIAVYIFASIIIYYVIPDFIPSIRLLRILLAGTLFYALSRVFSMYYSGNLGKPKIPSMIAWFLVLFNGVVNYFLIKNYQLTGAAVGTTLSFTVMLILNFCFFIKQSGKLNVADFFILKKEDIRKYSSLISEAYTKVKGMMRAK